MLIEDDEELEERTDDYTKDATKRKDFNLKENNNY